MYKIFLFSAKHCQSCVVEKLYLGYYGLTEFFFNIVFKYLEKYHNWAKKTISYLFKKPLYEKIYDSCTVNIWSEGKR